jgi:hypothetical protein
MSKSSKDKMLVALFPIMVDTWELNTQKHNISYGKKSMKTAPKIKLDTPELDEQAFGYGVFQGTQSEENKHPFCYSFHHWHFYNALSKKNKAIFKKMINDMIAYKLEQLLDYPENWKLQNDWIGSLDPHYQIIVLKNLQKAMNSKVWYRGSDLFMESALEEIITEHFDCAMDLHDDENWDDDEENPYAEDWKNWVSILGNEEDIYEYGFPHDDVFWDADWEMFSPDLKAIKDYRQFLLEK